MSAVLIKEDSPLYKSAVAEAEKNERQFKGVWIPAEIWLAKKWSWTEKVLWAEINSLCGNGKPCSASNAYLAKMIGTTETNIAKTISYFRQVGLLKTVSFDGRKRELQTAEFTDELRQGLLTGKLCPYRGVNIVTSIGSSLENNAESGSSETSEPSDGDEGERGYEPKKYLPKPHSKRATELAKARNRLCRMFGRKYNTKWSAKEEADLPVTLGTDEEDWLLLEEFHAAPYEGTFRRKEIKTILANWAMEIDRARKWVDNQNCGSEIRSCIS